MRFEAADFEGIVFDLDEQRPVRRWVWVDTDAGVVEAIQEDADGRPVFGENGPITYFGKGRFDCRLRPRKQQCAPGTSDSPDGPQRCGRCPSAMVLPGDDLCAVCRARQQGRDIRIEHIESVLAQRPCDNRCGRPATWSVMDMTAVMPVAGWHRTEQSKWQKALFKRSSMVGRRWYCQFCYQPPRILDAKGEVMTVLDNIVGRPE